MFLIDANKLNVEKKYEYYFNLFKSLFRGRESEVHKKIKTGLSLFVLSLLAATKTLFKRKEKRVYFYVIVCYNYLS